MILICLLVFVLNIFDFGSIPRVPGPIWGAPGSPGDQNYPKMLVTNLGAQAPRAEGPGGFGGGDLASDKGMDASLLQARVTAVPQ